MRPSRIIQGSYVVLKLLGPSSPNGYRKMSTWLQLLVERQKIYSRWGSGPAKSPRGLYG